MPVTKEQVDAVRVERRDLRLLPRWRARPETEGVPVKRYYDVTIRVTVRGSKEQDFRFAERDLRRDPPHFERMSVGRDGCYSAKRERRRATVVPVTTETKESGR